MQDFHYLDVWHKAHAFTLNIYRITEAFPKVETFGLAASLRRGAAAISMKIAEGCGRDTNAEFVDCLQRRAAWAWMSNTSYCSPATFTSSNLRTTKHCSIKS
jgi:hypothetical protein